MTLVQGSAGRRRGRKGKERRSSSIRRMGLYILNIYILNLYLKDNHRKVIKEIKSCKINVFSLNAYLAGTDTQFTSG